MTRLSITVAAAALVLLPGFAPAPAAAQGAPLDPDLQIRLAVQAAPTGMRDDATVQGWAADGSFTVLREAVVLEDAMKYDEPPAWMQPVRHALGALLMGASVLPAELPPSGSSPNLVKSVSDRHAIRVIGMSQTNG